MAPLVKRAVVYTWQFSFVIIIIIPPLKVREVLLTKPDTLRHSWLLYITEHRAWHNPRNIIGTTPGTLFWYKGCVCSSLTCFRLKNMKLSEQSRAMSLKVKLLELHCFLLVSLTVDQVQIIVTVSCLVALKSFWAGEHNYKWVIHVTFIQNNLWNENLPESLNAAHTEGVPLCNSTLMLISHVPISWIQGRGSLRCVQIWIFFFSLLTPLLFYS